MSKYNVLIVDDEEDICEILKFNLQSENITVKTLNSAEEVLNESLDDYHLILLDVMMGGMSGFQLADKIRHELNNDIPIIFLTAKDTENDLLTGFNIGADDYIYKPFSIKEVGARVNAVLKRKSLGGESKLDVLKVKDLELDANKKTVHIGGELIGLTKTEYEILSLLISHEEKIYSRDDIIAHVWDDNTYVSSRTVDVHITRLRKKINEYGKYIRNKSGYGYCFAINN